MRLGARHRLVQFAAAVALYWAAAVFATGIATRGLIGADVVIAPFSFLVVALVIVPMSAARNPDAVIGLLGLSALGIGLLTAACLLRRPAPWILATAGLCAIGFAGGYLFFNSYS